MYSAYDGLSTQVPVGVEEGLKHESSIHCDELISIPKSSLTSFVGVLSPGKIAVLNRALVIAVSIDSGSCQDSCRFSFHLICERPAGESVTSVAGLSQTSVIGAQL
jgi:hypothetical protein